MNFPEHLTKQSVGQQVIISGLGAFKGHIDQSFHTYESLGYGKTLVELNKMGITIETTHPSIKHESFHFDRIISLKLETGEKLATSIKSVAGKAIVGGILLGPAGAIIGGVLGANKKKYKNEYFMVVNFWDLNTKAENSIIISGKKLDIQLFRNEYVNLKLAFQRAKNEGKSNQQFVKETKSSTNKTGEIIAGIIALIFMFFVIRACG